MSLISDKGRTEKAVVFASGFSLIEVLVALLVLSIGLLGLAGMQVRGVAGNFSALQRSQATLFAYDIAERMRANRAAALEGRYAIDFGQAPLTSLPPQVRTDISEWLAEVDDLPDGEGAVTMASLGVGRTKATIQVQWNEKGDMQMIEIETIL